MDKTFKVGVFGLAPNEVNTLGSIFKLAAARSRKYVMVGAAERASAEILLVDVDSANSISEWKSFSVHHNNIPIVKVTKAAVPETSPEIYLRRPLTLKRVLEVLDKVTIDVHKFVPELVVGGDTPLDEASSAALQGAAHSAQQAARTGIKALVVDDSLPVRKSMEIQLGLYGMEIDFAETGEEALEFAKQKVYDIIFLDLMLPGIDGYKVCKVIKSEKISKNTPVVMLTGKGSRFDKLRGTMAGASVYLTKPVEQAKLREVIKQFLPNAEAGG
ncbi:response regulator with CheY-like receiver domain and winged-helix DNA-binding domain [Beggiatoa alba B18LD]|uniref:Response regulator with CheY-like receiver domain and winged-helix DNA-binding domain n=1 Tax=Beggiatoa alba B18LD TaxID=395493 RepID=I3CJK9_9GAMM|nr:response regulator [Beggiatoa alba]EIJ43802.1 response regulator with CheY-like receiver domain and winged-helix DNA-binding domain [Beggiatoa alba B18LD]